ncbi:phosphoribosylanthranilate isomerase [Venenivibrio stagnispumantis]|uniref:N-(5'-phosphoribosyl)anthranilate isomerase n=1 Tax=Venenivibrio stagnispumantis TaxID=407998 RepID=A0AA45WL16_9AQUI|nr:phosphoribosylanthranilate isomerase [Venenivibrio stagnispumantis]MCW4573670.1 phosphoribosylanthranilate isomerase [Venenivibrio stagnispumantis]SMP09827.1 phosphoribosylanthranilate isomerase [Venenivibrio stagnispumantis]
MIIKICGITEENQAKEISQLGADYIGVVLYQKSPRFIPLEKVKKIKNSISDKTKLVAVVVNSSEEEIKEILKIADIVQLHGDEDINFVKKFPKNKVIKALRIKDEEDIKKVEEFIKEGYIVLVDAYKEGEYGGTGKRINLELLEKLKPFEKNIIISGGFSEENIGEILSIMKPFGIDASSKLEIKPGLKDIQKIKNFIKIARELQN